MIFKKKCYAFIFWDFHKAILGIVKILIQYHLKLLIIHGIVFIL